MTAALTWARVSYRQQRWELILVAVGVALVAGAMLWFAMQLDALRAASPDCVPPAEASSPSCTAILGTYYEIAGLGDNLLLLSFAAPFGMGVLLGAPLVAREIDGGTAQLAWSIGRSRIGWLLRRIAFVTIVVIALLAILAVTSELLAAALAPELELSQAFAWFGRRGWLIVARGFGGLMLGMLVGAFIGRVLPAILAASLVIALVFVGITFAMDRWNQGEAVAQRFMNGPNQPAAFDRGALAVSFGIELRSGELVTYDDLYQSGVTTQITDERGRAYESEADFEAGNYIGHEVQMVIPGERYPKLVAREAAVAGALGVVTLGGTALVVRRRRPV